MNSANTLQRLSPDWLICEVCVSLRIAQRCEKAGKGVVLNLQNLSRREVLQESCAAL